MSKHRNPRSKLANNAPPGNFNPGDALERLYSELVDVEAFAHAASEAVALLPSTSSAKLRRMFARLYALVSKTADQANIALTLSEQLVAELSADMAARRAANELDNTAC
jgi:hypothetical protein